MKPHLNSAKGLLDKRKSIWRKQFLTFLTGTLVDEEEQKIYDDNSKTRFEIATFLIQQKHPPEATSFWGNFELERQLAIKKDIFDKKSQIDALNVLDASRSQKSNEYIGKVNSRAESADTSSGQKRKKKKSIPLEKGVNFFKNFYYLLHEQAKISRDVDPFINNNRAEGSTHSKATPSSLGSQSLEMPIGATEMTSDINNVNSSGCDIPRTPPHQIHSTSENQDLLKRLSQEKQRTKSTYEPICSNIIDTTNRLLMDRLQIKRDYTWDPVTNEATKYIDELIDNSDTRNKFRSKLQLPFVSPDETYSFSKHYEIHWVHRFADKLSLFFEAPRNPLLDKNSEGWLNCHVLAPLIDDCFLTCEEIQIHRGEKISLASTERKNLLRDDSETYVDEDQPISYKHKILREMKDQLDCLLKKLKFTRETIKQIKNIVVHGINQGGLNGKIYAMYYDNDLQYYFVFETCRYRVGTTWGSIPESLMSLKDILRLKEDINNALDTVKKIKLIALRTKSEDLFTIDNLPETTVSPKKTPKNK
ncbi:7322_t:CDS:10 [Paraglomus brasilianum]|uniref:7322_t:CDS:1 n=1 Tax=Paraglomus brasilianum TaxID=144538 RepID=A0A9N9GQP9_9GLOM|nr:7322_t:CDS:10 [Paraglomus brasilianum]